MRFKRTYSQKTNRMRKLNQNFEDLEEQIFNLGIQKIKMGLRWLRR